METRPPKKSFWMVPFTIHATRGLLRDQRSRRKTMAVSLVVAIVLLVAGLTIFRPWLDPHEHPWRFILYWLACAWETVLVLLLALFDLLLVRAQARAARRVLRKKVADSPDQTSSGETEDT
jgi:protein-S-isoprenylcysteine O-methyltransferase Ste14